MSILSNLFSKKGSGDSGYLAQAAQAYQNINLPSIDEMKIQLQQLVDQGQITPEEAQNQFAKIQTDPAFMAAAKESLAGLQDIYKQGGLTPQDKEQLAQIRAQTQTAERGSREALQAQAAARGMGGSGMNYAQQLANQQGSASRQSTGDLGVASMAQQRALQAMIQAGQFGSQLEGQQFGEEAQKAAAANAINQFNVSNKNAAQYYNLGEKQRISDTNAGLGNQQEMYNKGLYQQNFANQMAKAGGMAGAYTNQANLANQRRQQDLGFMGNLLGTAGQVGAAFLARGGRVPGIPRVKGNSKINDIVPAKLSPGEIVVPRTAARNPMTAAAFAGRMAEGPMVHPHDLEGMLTALARMRAHMEIGGYGHAAA